MPEEEKKRRWPELPDPREVLPPPPWEVFPPPWEKKEEKGVWMDVEKRRRELEKPMTPVEAAAIIAQNYERADPNTRAILRDIARKMLKNMEEEAR